MEKGASAKEIRDEFISKTRREKLNKRLRKSRMQKIGMILTSTNINVNKPV